MKFCNKCGKEIEKDERFCGNCGNNFSSTFSNKTVSINVVDYFKDPVITIKNLVYSLDLKFTAIIFLVISLLIAYVPYKPINKIASRLISGVGMFEAAYASEIKSAIKSIYFTFLILSIVFFITGGLAILIYSHIRSSKETFMKTLNIYILSSIPAVLTILLSSLILGINTLSIMIIILGFTVSTILLYSQLRKVLLLSEIEAFISLVLVNLLSYSITFYIAFIIIKDKLEAFESMF